MGEMARKIVNYGKLLSIRNNTLTPTSLVSIWLIGFSMLGEGLAPEQNPVPSKTEILNNIKTRHSRRSNYQALAYTD